MGAELSWSTTGSCPAQLPDQEQDHFSTPDHIHNHLFNFLWDLFYLFLFPTLRDQSKQKSWFLKPYVEDCKTDLLGSFCRTKQGKIQTTTLISESRTTITVYTSEKQTGTVCLAPRFLVVVVLVVD